MMKCDVVRCREGWETGTLLIEMLDERGVTGGPARVCYGGATLRTPALNANCQLDKMERMRRMQQAGVSLVTWTEDPAVAARMRMPLFARQAFGYGARDLMPVFQPEEIPWRVTAGWNWFSEVVPIERELRVWVWRDEVLDTYEKVMERPQDYKAMGRNFGQGFEFRPAGKAKRSGIYNELEAAARQSIAASAAIGLDFGAVDMIVGKDGRVYVLEVNTAPGVIRSGAQATLGKLADRIAEWCKADCPTGPAREARRAVSISV